MVINFIANPNGCAMEETNKKLILNLYEMLENLITAYLGKKISALIGT
jgi:hypothetical protein